MKNKKHIQTQTEWENEVSIDIINYINSELYLDFPFFSIALGALLPLPNEEITTFATDGSVIYFSAKQLIRVFKNNTYYLDRVYLHSMLHCMFSHLWIAGQRDRQLWGIACDIVVEYVIDHMDKPCTKRALSWIRQQMYGEIEKLSGISAVVVYYFIEKMDREKLSAVAQEFFTDDHRFWPKEENSNASMQSEAQEKWNRISRQTSMEQKKRGDEESDGQAALMANIKSQRQKRSYREFLKKFSVLREEIKADPDEFDLGYYNYGLRTYGNIPLIEPLESRENKKIQEFVIVVDTSYSTSGKLIENFLKETFGILTETDSFFVKSRVRIIQCDDRVQMDEEVKNEYEINALMNRFTVVGGGGTDFRPAFSYVNNLVETGELKNLSGLIYFTDGKGIYPRKRPPYKCAFLYLEDYDEAAVPPWAIRMRLTQEEFL